MARHVRSLVPVSLPPFLLHSRPPSTSSSPPILNPLVRHGTFPLASTSRSGPNAHKPFSFRLHFTSQKKNMLAVIGLEWAILFLAFPFILWISSLVLADAFRVCDEARARPNPRSPTSSLSPNPPPFLPPPLHSLSCLVQKASGLQALYDCPRLRLPGPSRHYHLEAANNRTRVRSGRVWCPLRGPTVCSFWTLSVLKH